MQRRRIAWPAVTDTSEVNASGSDHRVGDRLRTVATLCSGGGCPAVYSTDSGTLLVQGYIPLGHKGVNLPQGEALVEIPFELLRKAADLMR